MADFINTVDALGDDAVLDGIIQKTIEAFEDSELSEVGQYALNKCTALTEVNLPACTKIGVYAFQGCASLKSVSIPKLTAVSGLASHMTDSSIFADCSSLESIDFPLLGNCGFGAFANCKSLKEVNLPVLRTGVMAVFKGCSSLDKICLPQTSRASTEFFSGCTSLKLADLGVADEIYSDTTFYNCKVLTALVLRNQSKVCTLYFANPFRATPIESGTGYIYVPRALVDSYKSATNWSAYANQLRALEDYTVDGTTTGELDETKI